MRASVLWIPALIPSLRALLAPAIYPSARTHFFASGCHFSSSAIGAAESSSTVLIKNRPSGATSYCRQLPSPHHRHGCGVSVAIPSESNPSSILRNRREHQVECHWLAPRRTTGRYGDEGSQGFTGL